MMSNIIKGNVIQVEVISLSISLIGELFFYPDLDLQISAFCYCVAKFLISHVYVYMCIYMCVYMCVYMCLYVYMYIYLSVYVCVYENNMGQNRNKK